MFDFALMERLSGVVSEVSQGAEGPPEASFGRVVVQGWSDGGEDEACGALRPGEPDAWFGTAERLPDQWVVDGVDVASATGAYRQEGLGFGGQDLACEQAGRLVGHVSLWQSDGVQASFQGFQDARADGLLEHEHDTWGWVAERGGNSLFLHTFGEAGYLVCRLLLEKKKNVAGLAGSLRRGSHGGRG